MNKKYIVEFNFEQQYGIPVEVTAESGEQALNQAQGMLHGEWTNIVDMNGHSIRIRPEKVVSIRIVDQINN